VRAVPEIGNRADDGPADHGHSSIVSRDTYGQFKKNRLRPFRFQKGVRFHAVRAPPVEFPLPAAYGDHPWRLTIARLRSCLAALPLDTVFVMGPAGNESRATLPTMTPDMAPPTGDVRAASWRPLRLSPPALMLRRWVWWPDDDWRLCCQAPRPVPVCGDGALQIGSRGPGSRQPVWGRQRVFAFAVLTSSPGPGACFPQIHRGGPRSRRKRRV